MSARASTRPARTRIAPFAARRLSTWLAVAFAWPVVADAADAVQAAPAATCARAAASLDAWLQATDPGRGLPPDFPLRSALRDEHEAQIPAALQGQLYGFDARAARHARSAQATLAGAEVQAYGYRVGGECNRGILELVAAGSGRRLAVQHAPAPRVATDPADESAYADERLLLIGGRPYFAHLTWSQGYVRLYDFGPDLRTLPMCVVQRAPAARERVRFAADAALCDAVLEGRVDGSVMRPKAAVALDDEGDRAALGLAHMGSSALGTPPDAHASYVLVGEGLADMLNDGLRERVGLVARDWETRRGCGGHAHAEWVVALAADGSVANAPLNRIAFEHAKAQARVFEYGGATYYETRTRQVGRGIPSHEVWRLDGSGGRRICEFNPARYEVRRPVGSR